MRITMLLLAAALLAGCATSQGPVAISSACLAWKPVSSSVQDTDQTRAEVVANNAAWEAYCGGQL